MTTPAIRRAARVASRHACVLVVAMTFAGSAQAQSSQATGRSSASLALAFAATVPAALQLGLEADVLSFDIATAAGGEDGLACQLGPVADDPIASSNLGDARVLPAGTTFLSTTWPSIEITGGRGLRSYPPPPEAGRVICYRSFLARPFANVATWSLAATRSDLPGAPPLDAVYVGGGCRDDEPPGLALLSERQGVQLATSTTEAAAACDAVRVVVAVDVTAQTTTTASTIVRYTLVSGDSEFDRE